MEIYGVEAAPGMLGISPMPGVLDGVEADVARIAHWGAGLVLSMTGDGELERAGVGALGPALVARGIAWRHLPVEDWGWPSEEVRCLWPDAAAAAHAVLDAGGRVLAHCRGGCGRSGMAVLRLLVERGEAPRAALARIRAVRSCAVEAPGQYDWAAEGSKDV